MAIDEHCLGNHDKPRFTIKTAPAYCDAGSGVLTSRTIRRAVEAGELKSFRLAGKHLFSPAQLDMWLASRSGGTQ